MEFKTTLTQKTINSITHTHTHTRTYTMTQSKTKKNFITYQISKTNWDKDRQVDTQ